MIKTSNIFGQRLKMLRKMRNNTSQLEFAKELNLPQPTLSAYENGKIKPNIDALISISEKCNVSIDWLCGKDYKTNMSDMGDVLSFFLELFETNEFSIKTTIHDRVDIEETDATNDEDRNWVELKVYHNEVRRNKAARYNLELADAITKAYDLTQALKRYESSQEGYERDKAHFIEHMSILPITKIDHSNLSNDERHRLMIELIEKEYIEREKQNDD